MSLADPALVDALAARIGAQSRPGRTRVIGLCGPQGSGKSTLASGLSERLAEQGLRTATLSLDDLYLTRAEREALARDVHPLFRTRGVPGTHDVALGLLVLDALARPGTTRLLRFDKAADDRAPESAWEGADGPVDVVLFEGWCVGARAQPAEALVDPVNALERDEDPDGLWRAHVNAALAGPYRQLFDRLDLLILLQAPNFNTVLRWRTEQERALRARLAAAGATGRAMTDADVARFVQHYERLTRWIAADAPARADLVMLLDAERRGEIVG